MTDPNPLREDEVEQVARAIADADCSGLRASGINADIKHWRSFEREARAAIATVNQMREERAKSLQQQAYEAQSPLGIVPLPGYPVDQVREGRGK